jgi:23S rRNA G2445 N2-methylase RlmL
VGLAEIRTKLHASHIRHDSNRGEVVFESSKVSKFDELRALSDFFLVADFAVPRPGALTNDQFMKTIASLVKQGADMAEVKRFRLEMRGRDSSAIKRLRDKLVRESGITEGTKEDAAILLRLFPAQSGWRLMVRPRGKPLSVRQYRRNNFAGAINGVAAHCILRLLRPKNLESVVDLCCGSGTFLAELSGLEGRLSQNTVIGFDISQAVLSLAQENLREVSNPLLIQSDSRRLPLQKESVTACIANLPWGEQLGKRSELQDLYVDLLVSANEVTMPGGEVLFVTQHHQALHEAIEHTATSLELRETGKFSQRGFHPHYFHFDKSKRSYEA